jgi:hypothetical protein
MPEQERSIKARSHELFVEPDQAAEGTRPTKPFPVYIRETPAQPMSPATKAIFWIVGIVVAGLFIAAVWRITQRHGLKRPAGKAAAKTVDVLPWDHLQRRAFDRLEGAALPRVVVVPVAIAAVESSGDPAGIGGTACPCRSVGSSLSGTWS